MSMSEFVSTREVMKSVKTAWDKAPSGPKKEAALSHYRAAEKSLEARNEADCLKSLEEARAALA